MRRSMQGTVGLVPTMGYLHDGHLSLVKRAIAENDHVIVTIFVNPSQFGPNEDLAKYPRDIPADLEKIEKAGDSLVWMPSADEIYPDDFQTWVNVEKLTLPLEGEIRPGHFKGVTTIVAKLFNVTQPTRAYFGQKDIQQVTVINQMVKDLNYPLQVIVCPTVREADGLAMSSRNSYLNSEERRAAPAIYKGLQAAYANYLHGVRSTDELIRSASEMIGKEPLAMIQYIRCNDPNTLAPIELITKGAILSVAVKIGNTRLIDNIILE